MRDRCPPTWGRGRWQAQRILTPAHSWASVLGLSPRHPAPGVRTAARTGWAPWGILKGGTGDAQVTPKWAATKQQRLVVWGQPRDGDSGGDAGSSVLPGVTHRLDPPAAGAGGLNWPPSPRWGSCTLKCKPAFQCKCCERLGPIKARGQGGAWPRDTAPQGAQVSGGEGGAADPRRTRPGMCAELPGEDVCRLSFG